MLQKISYLLLATIFILTGCEKDDKIENPTKLSGVVEKGPFIAGSTVSLYELDDNLNGAGNVFTSQTNDEGWFEISNSSGFSSKYVKISVNGFYFNEVTGQLSGAPIILEAIADINLKGNINVNLLTHLEASRVIYLVTEENKTFAEAKKQAEKELLAAFYIHNKEIIPEETHITGNNTSANILIAISSILLNNKSDAEFYEFCNQLREDLKDGNLEETTKQKIKTSSTLVDTWQIRQNLISRYESLGKDIQIGNFHYFIDHNGDGILEEYEIPGIDISFFWETETDANTGILATYYSFSKAMVSGYWNWGEARSDNFTYYEKDAPDQGELVTNNIQINNIAAFWTTLYATIGKANAAIQYIPYIEMSLANKKDYLAEAYALRAWCYFYCIRVWGDIPVFLEPIDNDQQGIYRERVSKGKILEEIILPDIEKAYEYIDKTKQETSSKRTRLNAATICALLMDVHAWMHNYDLVIKVKEERINSLGTNWNYLVAEDGINFESQWRQMFFESTSAESSPEVWLRLAYDRYGSGSNSMYNYFFGSTCKYRVSDKLRTSYATTDKREKNNVQWNISNGVTRLNRKFWDDGTSTEEARNSDVDLVMYRYADVILLYAEALNAVGRTDEAITELNKIHTRAGNAAYNATDFADTDALLDAIVQERQWEFVGEGKRWFDLVRTGRWRTEISLEYGMTEEKLLFPIHRDHLIQNPYLTQNPSYAYP